MSTVIVSPDQSGGVLCPMNEVQRRLDTFLQDPCMDAGARVLMLPFRCSSLLIACVLLQALDLRRPLCLTPKTDRGGAGMSLAAAPVKV
jgi:hypothetical protein